MHGIPSIKQAYGAFLWQKEDLKETHGADSWRGEISLADTGGGFVAGKMGEIRKAISIVRILS